MLLNMLRDDILIEGSANCLKRIETAALRRSFYNSGNPPRNALTYVVLTII
jgi:hypothetical protein